ncbi:hypothetical protein ACFXKC_07820 [Streptomyces sp. NPDC059340]|uniref:hypothetical protein n=1 Tax=Streptomyces sp. NPDC059340 TaxID=3346806 RepID=UPI00368FC1DA
MDGQDPEVRDDIPPRERDNALLQAADRLAAAAEILVSVSARTAVAVDSRLSPPLLRALTLVGTDPGLTLAALAERPRSAAPGRAGCATRSKKPDCWPVRRAPRTAGASA